MLKRKYLIPLIVIIFAAGVFFFFVNYSGKNSDLEKLRKEHPEWSESINEILASEEKLKGEPNNVTNYLALGMAWKNIGDKAKDLKLSNYQDYYRKALESYKQGVEISQRKNTLVMVNAGRMAEYLEDFNLAEEYYKEAITVSPGDVTYYVALAELYEYKMHKPKEEITALYDQGMKKVLDRGFLQARKDDYLKRTEN